MITIRHLDKYYISGEIKLHALKDINFEIGAGEITAIMGSSGSGKSTLMNIIGCLDRMYEGTYILDGINVSNMTEKELCGIRNTKIGFVFQSFNLLSKLTALENVELPLIYGGCDGPTRHKKAQEMLEQVGLGDRLHHRPNELSGGQKQRVAIARALINDPAIVLADEPTGNLDSVSKNEIMELFVKLNKAGKTVAIVSHEPETKKYVKRILTFKDGMIIKDEVVS
ncbi:MAG: ABC transporter ATP-binding protein [Fusobacteriaceae bacterium]|jgi:putative ABC transport system ATP-binding protein|nr:ABC transporter ATP-binding protein [Fusobacteriaceae bacterium]